MIWLWDKQSAESLLFLSFCPPTPRLDHNMMMAVMMMMRTNRYSGLAMSWLKSGIVLRALFAFTPCNSYDKGPV